MCLCVFQSRLSHNKYFVFRQWRRKKGCQARKQSNDHREHQQTADNGSEEKSFFLDWLLLIRRNQAWRDNHQPLPVDFNANDHKVACQQGQPISTLLPKSLPAFGQHKLCIFTVFILKPIIQCIHLIRANSVRTALFLDRHCRRHQSQQSLALKVRSFDTVLDLTPCTLDEPLTLRSR